MQPSPAQQLFEKGIAAARAGDLAAAESNLRKCIELDPRNAVAMLNLGIMMMNAARYSEAERLLVTSLNLQPTLETLTTLGRLFENSGETLKAENCYRQILRANPAHTPTLIRLAEIAEAADDSETASNLYKMAWEADRSNVAAATGYATNSFARDPANAISVFDQLRIQLKNDDAAHLKMLTSLLPYKEFHERAVRGLPPYHAGSIDELFFTLATIEFEQFRKMALGLAEKNPHDLRALNRKFFAHFCAREFDEAHKVLDLMIPLMSDHIFGAVRLAPEYYEKLSKTDAKDLIGSLPEIKTVCELPHSDSEHTIFLSCNSHYFKTFGGPLVRSLGNEGETTRLHLHLMDASADNLAEVSSLLGTLPLQFAISVEQPGFIDQQEQAARNYYHAIRLVRFYQFLEQYKAPLWMMDVDALFHKSPSGMFATLGESDVCLRIRAGRFEPWHQFSACIVGASHTAESACYFRFVASYILDFWRQNKLQWGIDQLAMFGVYEFMRTRSKQPKLSFVGPQIADFDCTDDGIVWLTAGQRKFSLMKNATEREFNSAKNRYRQLFLHYVQ